MYCMLANAEVKFANAKVVLSNYISVFLFNFHPFTDLRMACYQYLTPKKVCYGFTQKLFTSNNGGLWNS